MLLTFATISAANVVRTTTDANTAALVQTIDLFRDDLGGVNNGVG